MTLLQLEKEIERLKKRVVELELSDRTVDVVSFKTVPVRNNWDVDRICQ